MRRDRHTGAAREKVREWTQRELARATGITRSSIANLETGRQRPPVHIALLIAWVLGVPVTDLLPSGLDAVTIAAGGPRIPVWEATACLQARSRRLGDRALTAPGIRRCVTPRKRSGRSTPASARTYGARGAGGSGPSSSCRGSRLVEILDQER